MLKTTITVLAAVALLALPTWTVATQPEQESQESWQRFNAALADYQRYCQSCHGKEGRGDGSVAKWLKVPPPDLTQLSERHDGVFPAERAMRVVDGREEVKAHGRREMPIWGEVLAAGDEPGAAPASERITGLVDVLRWLDDKPAPPAG